MTLNVAPNSIARSEVEALAFEMGVPSNEITIRNPEWIRYLQDGALVTVNLGRYRAKVGLTLEDLGIQPESAEARASMNRILSPGHRYLLPVTILKRAQEIESRARYRLKVYGFKTFWGRWIHKARYAEWRAQNEEIKAEYFALADEVMERWDALVDQVRQDYASFALGTLNRLIAEGLLVGYDDDEAKIEWCQTYVEKAMARVPSAQKAREAWRYDTVTEYLPMQQTLAADRAAAEATKLRAQEIARLEAEDVFMADLRRTEARNAVEGLNTFIADLKAQVNDQVYTAAENCLEALRNPKNKGKLPRNSTKELKNLIEFFQGMVFWPEADIEAKLTELGRLIEIRSEKRDNAAVSSILTELGTQARIVLLELDREPSRNAKKGRDFELNLDLDVGRRRRLRASTTDQDVLIDEDMLDFVATRRGMR